MNLIVEIVIQDKILVKDGMLNYEYSAFMCQFSPGKKNLSWAMWYIMIIKAILSLKEGDGTTVSDTVNSAMVHSSCALLHTFTASIMNGCSSGGNSTKQRTRCTSENMVYLISIILCAVFKSSLYNYYINHRFYVS